jgi:hypothetical protein
MTSSIEIPYYAPDGSSLGSRTIEAARRLIADGYVKPSYGRKGHLRAIWLQSSDGGNPIEARSRGGTRYSFIRNLEHGRCWQLKRLDGVDENGVRFSARNVFLQVVSDCLVS